MSSAAKRPVESELAQGYRRESLWLDSLDESLDPLPSLHEEIRCDVVIIGAGFSGLWTAYHLKKAAPDIDIVILEAEIAGFGASGRNGGALGAWMAGFEAWASNPATRDSALALQRALIDTVERVGEIARDEGIDCHYAREGIMMTARTPGQEKNVRQTAQFFESLGFGPPDFRLLDAEETRRRVAIEDARVSFYCSHFAAIHPARLARGLAHALRRKGVRLYERSRVTELSEGRVLTGAGLVNAKTVIMAAEAYAKDLKGFGRRVAPVHSQIIATAPLGNQVYELTGMTDRTYFSVLSSMPTFSQLTADRRIILGTRDDYQFGSRLRTRDEYGMHTRDTRYVYERLIQTLPKLRDVPITHSWGGPLAITRNRKPFVMLDDKKRFGWIGGYSGSGLTPSCLLGETMSDLILGQRTSRTALPYVRTDLPPNWEPEPLRWIGIAAFDKFLHLRTNFGH